MSTMIALSDDQLRRSAPSIFAEAPHASHSERFGYVPTFQILTALQAEGFVPVRAHESRTRDETRHGFTKHMIRLRHRSEIEQTITRAIGDVFPEVVLLNAHDGTSAYVMNAGLFRLVCLNGMVVRDRKFGRVKVPHTGNVRDRVIEGSYTVLREATKAIEVAEEWQGITLDADERVALAEAAHEIRFGDHEGNVSTAIKADQLLIPRRYADSRDPSLWVTFNTIQENAIKGGLQGRTVREDGGRGRRVATREIKGIDQDVKLNRALWALAAKMADISLGRETAEPQHEPEVAELVAA